LVEIMAIPCFDPMVGEFVCLLDVHNPLLLLT
jgi:hypothetical protein